MTYKDMNSEWKLDLFRMQSSGMLRRVTLERTDVSEEHSMFSHRASVASYC
jgi:hypothetical protein